MKIGTSMPEEWRKVLRIGDHEVSSLGRVRRISTQSLKNPSQRKDGRLAVHLSSGSKSKVCLVHSLVAESFLRPRKGSEIVVFQDGDPSNCRASNLKFEPRTIAVPYAPPKRDGLTSTDVSAIRYLLENGVSGRLISEAFGVSEPLVSKIKQGQKWPTQGERQID